MIIVKIQGGLGNQLFQYAVGRNLAYQHGSVLKLDIRWYTNTNSTDTVRKFRLDHFHTKKEIATDLDIKSICNPKKDISPIKFFRESISSKKSNYLKEKSLSFDPDILKSPDNVYLDGFWASEKYFINIEKIIREDLMVKDPPDEINRSYAHIITSCESTSIHIRRGDYVNNPKTKEFHGNCSENYYYEAMDLIASSVKNPNFFIFSDDCAWVKNNFKTDYPMSYIDFNEEGRDYEDLRLLSLCKYHIIANSTFSWWGAWLSNDPSKIVIAPKNWYNNPCLETADLIPKSWMRI
jgi:hypothetical protein